MLSVLLTILKIIGIVLAVVFGLVVLVLLLVLFVPIRYEILARYENNKPYAKVNVTYLLKLVRFKLEFMDELIYEAKVLFFTLLSSATEDAKEEDKAKKPKKSKKSKKKEENVFDEEDSEDSFFEVGKVESESVADTSEPVMTEKEKESEEAPVHYQSEEAWDSVEEEPMGFFEKIWYKITTVYERIKETLISVKEKVTSVWDSIIKKKEHVSEKVNEILRIINNEGNREFVRFLWEQIKYFLKKLKPKKGHLNVHFGMEDPETTGKIAMYLAVLYGLLGIEISILPDFDEQVMEGELYLKGRLQLYILVVMAFRIIRNKHFKRIVLKRQL